MMLEYTAHAAAAGVRVLAAPVAAQTTAVGSGVESHASFAPIGARMAEQALDEAAVAIATELVVAMRALRIRGTSSPLACLRASCTSARPPCSTPTSRTGRSPGTWRPRGGCSSSFERVSTAPQTGIVEPFRFEDGALLILDQRALPAEESWIRCETVEQVADCIRTLAVRGAPAIGIAAAYAMALADDREAAAELLRATRPTAVNLALGARAVPRRGRPARGRPRGSTGSSSEADRRLARAGRGAVRRGHPRAHPLQHRRARHRRDRHRLRGAARGLGAGPAR